MSPPRKSARPALEPRASAQEYALGLLSRRMRSRHELALALRKRRYAAVVIEEVLSALGRVGLVDDVVYAESYARSRVASRPRSERLLSTELRARGVSGSDVEEALARLRDRNELADDAGQARLALAKRARSFGRLSETDRREREIRFLRSRGFSFDTIRKVTGSGEDEGTE